MTQPQFLMSDEEAKVHSYSKMSKYNLKQIKAYALSELKYFMQSENDLKELTTGKVMQLITLFLNECLEIYPPAQEALVSNYDDGMFA